jgi:hypothetical protein
MKARKVIEDAAGKFDSTAQAILTRCEQSGVTLRLDDGHLRAKGDRETIAAWNPIIQRHKPEILAALSGQSFSPSDDAGDLATLAADYQELTTCIIELCRFAKYSDEVRERMLTARQNLYPYLYATELAYFRLQVIRAKAGTYWETLQSSQSSGDTTTSPTSRERAAGQSERGRA